MPLTKHWCLNESCGFEETSHKIRDGWNCPKCNGPMMNRSNVKEGERMSLTLHNGDLNKLARDTSQDSITLRVGEQEMVSLKSNGDIFVKGKLVENDKEVVDGMRELLMLSRSR